MTISIEVLQQIKQSLFDCLETVESNVVDCFEFDDKDSGTRAVALLGQIEQTLVVLQASSAASLSKTLKKSIEESLLLDESKGYAGFAAALLVLKQQVQSISTAMEHDPRVDWAQEALLADNNLLYIVSASQAEQLTQLAEDLTHLLDASIEQDFWQKLYQISKEAKSLVQTEESYTFFWLLQQLATESLKKENRVSTISDKKVKQWLAAAIDYLLVIIEEGESLSLYEVFYPSIVTLQRAIKPVPPSSRSGYKPPPYRLIAVPDQTLTIFPVSDSTLETVAFAVKKELAVAQQTFEISFPNAKKQPTNFKQAKQSIHDKFHVSKAIFQILSFSPGIVLFEEIESLLADEEQDVVNFIKQFSQQYVLLEDALALLQYRSLPKTLSNRISSDGPQAYSQQLVLHRSMMTSADIIHRYFKHTCDHVMKRLDTLPKTNFMALAAETHQIKGAMIIVKEASLIGLLSDLESAYLFLSALPSHIQKDTVTPKYLDTLAMYEVLSKALAVDWLIEENVLLLLQQAQESFIEAIEFDKSQMAVADYSQGNQIIAPSGIADAVAPPVSDKQDIEPEIEEDDTSLETDTDEFDVEQTDTAEFEAEESKATESEEQTEKVIPKFVPSPRETSEFDSEILEIFLEEAKEVTDSLSAAIPDIEAGRLGEELLSETRRSFHTLKGSGRMVGLAALGDFAEQHESLLKELLAGERKVDSAVQQQLVSGIMLASKTAQSEPFVEAIDELLESAAAAHAVRYQTDAVTSDEKIEKEKSGQTKEQKNSKEQGKTAADKESRSSEGQIQIAQDAPADTTSTDNKTDLQATSQPDLSTVAASGQGLLGKLADHPALDNAAALAATQETIAEKVQQGDSDKHIATSISQSFSSSDRVSKESTDREIDIVATEIATDVPIDATLQAPLSKLREMVTTDKPLDMAEEASFADCVNDIKTVLDAQEIPSWATGLLNNLAQLINSKESDLPFKATAQEKITQALDAIAHANHVDPQQARHINRHLMQLQAESLAANMLSSDALRQAMRGGDAIQEQKATEVSSSAVDTEAELSLATEVLTDSELAGAVNKTDTLPIQDMEMAALIEGVIDTAKGTLEKNYNEEAMLSSLASTQHTTPKNTPTTDGKNIATQPLTAENESFLQSQLAKLREMVTTDKPLDIVEEDDALVDRIHEVEAALDEYKTPAWAWELLANLENLVESKEGDLPFKAAVQEKISQALDAIANFDEVEARSAKKINSSLMRLQAESLAANILSSEAISQAISTSKNPVDIKTESLVDGTALPSVAAETKLALSSDTAVADIDALSDVSVEQSLALSDEISDKTAAVSASEPTGKLADKTSSKSSAQSDVTASNQLVSSDDDSSSVSAETELALSSDTVATDVDTLSEVSVEQSLALSDEISDKTAAVSASGTTGKLADKATNKSSTQSDVTVSNQLVSSDDDSSSVSVETELALSSDTVATDVDTLSEVSVEQSLALSDEISDKTAAVSASDLTGKLADKATNKSSTQSDVTASNQLVSSDDDSSSVATETELALSSDTAVADVDTLSEIDREQSSVLSKEKNAPDVDVAFTGKAASRHAKTVKDALAWLANAEQKREDKSVVADSAVAEGASGAVVQSVDQSSRGANELAAVSATAENNVQAEASVLEAAVKTEPVAVNESSSEGEDLRSIIAEYERKIRARDKISTESAATGLGISDTSIHKDLIDEGVAVDALADAVATTSKGEQSKATPNPLATESSHAKEASSRLDKQAIDAIVDNNNVGANVSTVAPTANSEISVAATPSQAVVQTISTAAQQLEAEMPQGEIFAPTVGMPLTSSVDVYNLFVSGGTSAETETSKKVLSDDSIRGSITDLTPQVLTQSIQDAGVDLAYSEPSKADSDILSVFLEEAKDIISSNRQSLDEWKDDSQNLSAIQEIQRGMHTLKGGAGMAELSVLGSLAHDIESLLDGVAQGQISDKAEAAELLKQGLAVSSHMVDVAAEDQRVYEDPKYISQLDGFMQKQTGTGLDSIVERKSDTTNETSDQSIQAVKLANALQQEKQQEDYLLRVKTKVVNHLSRLVGDDIIMRAQIERVIEQHDSQIVELSHTVQRVSEQIKDLEIEAEAQILSGSQENVETGITGDELFDALEMDHFSEMQQLSHLLSESVEDLYSISASLQNSAQDIKQRLIEQNQVQRGLQSTVLSMTLVRFDSITSRLQRLIDQVLEDTDKSVALKIVGGDVGVERQMLEEMTVRFEHVIRNAIAHGIESPTRRQKLNKSPQGTITLTARQEGTETVFVIADDGKGFDFDSIRQKAESLGWGTPEELEDTHYLLQLPFSSGFTTLASANKIAGRGIGLDVLHHAVLARQGRLSAESLQDKGLVLTIRLPFLMTVTDALIVKMGRYQYAVPVTSIQGVGRLSAHVYTQFSTGQTCYYQYGGDQYKIESLVDFMDPNTEREFSDYGVPVLLAYIDDVRIAFIVEELGTRQELIVNAVNRSFTALPGVIGAAVLDDGMPVPVAEITLLGRHFLTVQNSLKESYYQQQLPEKEKTKQQLKVLVVDDSVTMRKMTTKLLLQYDCEVQTAKDGLDAVNILVDWVPELILLDVEMPRMDGFELARHVRNLPQLSKIPIIMITSRTGDKHRTRAEEIGVNGYLGKPYTKEVLVEAIETVLETSLSVKKS